MFAEQLRLQVEHVGKIDKRDDGNVEISVCIRQGKRVAETLFCLII